MLSGTSLRAYSSVMNTIAHRKNIDSGGDQVDCVEPDRRTAIKYLLWVVVMMEMPYLLLRESLLQIIQASQYQMQPHNLEQLQLMNNPIIF